MGGDGRCIEGFGILGSGTMGCRSFGIVLVVVGTLRSDAPSLIGTLTSAVTSSCLADLSNVLMLVPKIAANVLREVIVFVLNVLMGVFVGGFNKVCVSSIAACVASSNGLICGRCL